MAVVVNLFSIFDPSGRGVLVGWMTLGLIVVVLPSSLCLTPYGGLALAQSLLHRLKAELNALLGPGERAHFSTLMLSLFSFVLILNFNGLIPYVFTPTSHLVLPICLAVVLWLSSYRFGWAINTEVSLAHLVPVGTPAALMPFIVLIETVRALIRPLTLSVRLMANMVAGHLLLRLAGGRVDGFISFLPLFISQTALIGLEIAVAGIQAYVFIVLVSLYAKEVFV